MPMQTAFFLWLGWAVYFNCVGWLLSALHQLNPVGYALTLLPPLAAGLVWLKKNPLSVRPQKIFRRFRRPLPAIFLFLAALVFLGGFLYTPTNFDGLTYRLPRMLNWLATGHWFWIPSINDRMNYSGVGWEWTALPLVALTHSDRCLFLINALGFLLLPGLLFSVFRQLGVARRVAWAWMWLLPFAYGYVTQAGSIGNDFMGALLALLAVHFGLRARRSGRVDEVWLSLLAVALMTGTKLSNLPLALPWLVAVWPALPRLRKNLVGTVVVTGAAVLVSAAPIMALNWSHTGNWTGDPHNQAKMQLHDPVAGFLGNSLLLVQQTFTPPVLPATEKINRVFTEKLPAAWQRRLHGQFPRYYQTKLNELPSEEGAGLGLGVALPLLLVAGMSLGGLLRPGRIKKITTVLPLVALAAWVATLFYLLKVGSESGPRLLLPYYPLALVPFLLLPAQARLMRCRAWRVFLVVCALSVLPVLVLSPARPLWPAQRITEKLVAAHPASARWQRMASVYGTYAHRNDLLAPLRAAIPEDVRTIGFIAGSNDTDYSLWRPFGRRQVMDLSYDARHFVEHPGEVEWLVVKATSWPEVNPQPLVDWVPAHHAVIVATNNIVELVSWGGETWYVIHVPKN